jgi:hypothetical protein
MTSGYLRGSNNLLAGASAQGGYTIENSLRFRASASAYLNRTPASAGNRKTWTWSGWFKRGASGDGTGSNHYFLFSATDGNSTQCDFYVNTIRVYFNGGTYLLQTTQLFRDYSAWYHIVVSVDTTQATASNRVKIYINGVQVTSFSTASYPTQNLDSAINGANSHYIGKNPSTNYFDGYMAEVNLIDGQALTPSDFGNYNATTGVWQPVAYEGTYGTNGFYLPFSDATNTTTLAEDASGNGNDWTPNNISLTAGVTYDSMTDVPTLTSATAANYAVLNPLDKVGSGVLTAANLDYATSSGTFDPLRGTIGVSSGKWYWEVTCKATSGASPNTFTIGIASQSTNINDASWYVGKDAASYSYYGVNGVKYNNNASTAYGASYTTGDVIGVALDMDAGTLVFYKNNTSQGTAFSSLVGTFMPAFSDGATSGTVSVAFNFGQRPFAYTPPAGFLPLHTGNLPNSAIVDGSEYFNTVLYTGDSSTNNTITGVGFEPDFVWLKARTLGGGGNHVFVDSVRGDGNAPSTTKELYSNLTNAESSTNIIGFNSDGFRLLSAGSGDERFNQSGQTYVAWNWKANGANVSNDEGSITSTVSANPTSGFSIVTYTGTGANATVGHGLGAAPNVVIVKNRDSGTIGGAVYHSSLGATKYLKLFQTTTGTDQDATDNTAWNGGSPTFDGDVFSVGSLNRTNTSTDQMLAYCFADVEGYSKFGKYVGNNSADGPFVHLGFRPAFVIVKASSTSGYSWNIIDTARDTYNTQGLYLFANTSGAEGSGSNVDILSNGFKLRNAGAGVNGSGITYIYMAFAENPFKNSLAR